MTVMLDILDVTRQRRGHLWSAAGGVGPERQRVRPCWCEGYSHAPHQFRCIYNQGAKVQQQWTRNWRRKGDSLEIFKFPFITVVFCGQALAKALEDCYNEAQQAGARFALEVFVAGRNRLENDGATALAAVFKVRCTFVSVCVCACVRVRVTQQFALFIDGWNTCSSLNAPEWNHSRWHRSTCTSIWQ